MGATPSKQRQEKCNGTCTKKDQLYQEQALLGKTLEESEKGLRPRMMWAEAVLSRGR